VVFGGCPKDWMAGCGIRDAALKVGEYHERLRLDRSLLDVFKAGAEADPAAAHGFERNRFTMFEDGGVVHLGVEIEVTNATPNAHHAPRQGFDQRSSLEETVDEEWPNELRELAKAKKA
jgi:hypothetical protein